MITDRMMLISEGEWTKRGMSQYENQRPEMVSLLYEKNEHMKQETFFNATHLLVIFVKHFHAFLSDRRFLQKLN
jgi:hypothetical protein